MCVPLRLDEADNKEMTRWEIFWRLKVVKVWQQSSVHNRQTQSKCRWAMLLFHLREAVWFEALWKVALHYSYTLEVVHLPCSRPSGRSICKHSENVMFHTFHTEPAPPTVTSCTLLMQLFSFFTGHMIVVVLCNDWRSRQKGSEMQLVVFLHVHKAWKTSSTCLTGNSTSSVWWQKQICDTCLLPTVQRFRVSTGISANILK